MSVKVHYVRTVVHYKVRKSRTLKCDKNSEVEGNKRLPENDDRKMASDDRR